ncbi:MAG: hypothetical protein MHM6MM_000094 [Cercozoa sp. M6MM]
MSARANSLLVGTGEYVTGFVNGAASGSDKRCGVVALVHFDLRRRGLHGDVIKMCGTQGGKFPQIRAHLRAAIENKYRDMDTSFESFPNDDVERDTCAYERAIESMQPGDTCTIFTPDFCHFDIAKCAMQRGLHVLLTKPPVQTLAQHRELVQLARAKSLHAQVEVHKRWDPIYADAATRIRAGEVGDLTYFHAFMSQPKKQLETFRAWAGKNGCDISYYLNSHHVDFLCWALRGRARAVSVSASASSGVARRVLQRDLADSVTLLVQFVSATGNMGTAVFTSSWTAAESDVHSQQRFFFQGTESDITVDQAHRGYTIASRGLASVNPLFMKYTPDARGHFAGQSGYGYKSIEEFHRAVQCTRGGASPEELHEELPTLAATQQLTAILEAGAKSLRENGRPVKLKWASPVATPLDCDNVIGFE